MKKYLLLGLLVPFTVFASTPKLYHTTKDRNTIWVVQDGQRTKFESLQVFKDKGYSLRKVRWVSPLFLNKIPDSGEVIKADTVLSFVLPTNTPTPTIETVQVDPTPTPTPTPTAVPTPTPYQGTSLTAINISGNHSLSSPTPFKTKYAVGESVDIGVIVVKPGHPNAIHAPGSPSADDLQVLFQATDDTQNKTMNGTGSVGTFYNAQGQGQTMSYYGYSYDFKTVGQHSITISCEGTTQTLTFTVE